MNLSDKIYIAGHTGLVGSAIVRNLESQGFTNLIIRTHKELDLTNQFQVDDFFKQENSSVGFPIGRLLFWRRHKCAV